MFIDIDQLKASMDAMSEEEKAQIRKAVEACEASGVTSGKKVVKPTGAQLLMLGAQAFVHVAAVGARLYFRHLLNRPARAPMHGSVAPGSPAPVSAVSAEPVSPDSTGLTGATEGRVPLYGAGRPSMAAPPKVPGEYRFLDKTSRQVLYVGETANLHVRKQQHTRTGRFDPETMRFAWKPAAGGSRWTDRRGHERLKIKKHQPPMNRVAGGGGRPSGVNACRPSEPEA